MPPESGRPTMMMLLIHLFRRHVSGADIRKCRSNDLPTPPCRLGGNRALQRLLPFAPQVSLVGNAALVEREAVTLPLDHAFGFELADVGPGCNRGAPPVPTR